MTPPPPPAPAGAEFLESDFPEPPPPPTTIVEAAVTDSGTFQPPDCVMYVRGNLIVVYGPEVVTVFTSLNIKVSAVQLNKSDRP